MCDYVRERARWSVVVFSEAYMALVDRLSAVPAYVRVFFILLLLLFFLLRRLLFRRCICRRTRLLVVRLAPWGVSFIWRYTLRITTYAK